MINHPPLSPANATQSAPAVEPIAEPVIHSFKGFDRDLKCRGHQFEVGKTYELAGRIHCCNHGWHACENPLDIFGHYPPGESRYAEVTQSGDIDRAESDTKLASAKITIGVEIHIHELIQKAVAWIISKAKPADCQHADGDRSAASSTGYQSAASSTGYQSAASSTGDRSAASSTGYQSAAMSAGRFGKVQGADGCALFLIYRDDDWNIVHAWAGIAGRDGIKPMVWYRLDKHGKPVEVSQ